MAVFINIPRNRYTSFMALELFMWDRYNGLFTYSENMKNTHNGPGMGTYCPGLKGSIGLNCGYATAFCQCFLPRPLTELYNQSTTTQSVVRCLSFTCVSWPSAVQSSVSFQRWSVNGTLCWAHCYQPTLRQTVLCPDRPGVCTWSDQIDQSSLPTPRTRILYTH